MYEGDAEAIGFLFGSAFILIPLSCILLGIYIYFSYSMMTIANKVGEPNGWLAFVPIANLYLLVKLAEQHGAMTFLFLLAVIPGIGVVFVTILQLFLFVKIAERRGFEAWWGILMIVPIVNLIVPGYIAFAEPTVPAKKS